MKQNVLILQFQIHDKNQIKIEKKNFDLLKKLFYTVLGSRHVEKHNRKKS